MSIYKSTCRHCNSELTQSFADLGNTPISNDYLSAEKVSGPDPFYPLHAFVCRKCFLVQLQDFFKSDDLFRSDYAYFSSFSDSWLKHVRDYASEMCETFQLDGTKRVVEIASNDGYLLQYFKELGVDILGIEPSASVANTAIKERNIPTEIAFFGVETATRLRENGIAADLMPANNVLAHVPDINDFVKGFEILLSEQGVATFEFPHLVNLIDYNQFDTIYHEHFSYLSLLAVEKIAIEAGLRIFRTDRLSTHGGSLRVYACKTSARYDEHQSVQEIRSLEQECGLHLIETYANFDEKVKQTKWSLLTLLIELKRSGKTIVGYGAPAKGNTLLNFCGIGADMIDFTVDRSIHKQGMFLPGTRLPIKAPEAIDKLEPDYVLILPWNLKDEIVEQMAHIRSWGGKFIVPIPQAFILD